ncbi:MAG: mechanosensitive ion channel domain-containing protein, partial [Cyanobium sp.]
GLLGLGLLLWRVISRRLMDLEVKAVATATADRKPEALSAAGSRAAQLPPLPGAHATLPAGRAETANLTSPTPWSTPAPTSTSTPRSLATPLARPSLRDRARRWLRRFVGTEAGGLRRALAISGLHLLSRVLLGGVVLLVPLMVGVAVLAIPGQISLAIALLLQPFGVVSKLAIGWLMAQLLKTVLAVLLSQWQYNPVLAPERRARRDQRTRSLLRVSQRLVTVLCIALVALWVLVEIPGVQDLSNNALLASGALLGALALVFQDLLRDFVGGLVLLLEDRYAIGDAITIDGLSGEVIDVNLLSTQLRSADQQVVVIPNSQCKRVVNATKLRSGRELHLTLAHHGGDPRRALVVIDHTAQALALAADPTWNRE